ncbi:LysM peptidoglycan-binding domain-containing protein [Legionella sp.]|uniref:lytic transglycosylase n=1 Tax=Legionella sp. TaxID=459 RepID=UPI0039E45447
MKLKLFIIKKILFCFLIFYGISGVSIAHTTSDVWEVLRSEFRINHETSRAEVQEQIRWLVSHPSYLQKVCRQSEPYIYHILGEIKKRKLPGELALLPMIESAYDPFAYSGVGAAGLWQLMPRTGADLGLKQDWWFDGRRSIRPSTEAALSYLIYLNKFFEGNWILAIAAYDSGEGTISRAIKVSQRPTQNVSFWELLTPRETQIYVPRLLALAEVIKNPQRYRISLPEIPYLPYFEEVNIGSQIDLSHAAKLAGISYKELIKLNPGYNRWTTAPYKPFKLLIPAEKVQQFNSNLANFPEEKRVSWTKHQVKQGDNLDNIAIRYHTTVNLIKQLNQLPTNTITPNQSLLIPSTKNAPTLIPQKEIAIAKTTPFSTGAINSTAKLLNPIREGNNRRVIHIVQGTDSYQRLEQLYGVTIKEIQSWNKMSAYQRLQTGQQLVIWKQVKQPKQYIVQRGDNLNIIAKKNQIQVNKILSLNPGLRWNAPLQHGQRIRVG